MVEFVDNNAKNASFGYTPFKLNCGYYLQILYKDNINSHFKSKLADKLSAKLRKLRIICRENLYYTYKF